MWTYVVENEIDCKIQVTDFFSMNNMVQTCTSKEKLGHNHDAVSSANLYYYGLTKNSLLDILKTALWISKDEMGVDAFSGQNLMDNEPEMYYEQLGFMPGDGALYYYLVNWSLGTQELTSNDIGTILI